MNNKNKYVSCRIIDHECASRRIIDSKYVSCGIIDNEIKNNLSLDPTSLSLPGCTLWQRRSATPARVNGHTTCVMSDASQRIMCAPDRQQRVS